MKSRFKYQVLPYKKIFVVGVPGSGKTTFAKNYSYFLRKKYIDYDANYDYNADKKTETARLLSILPDEFIMDNVAHTDEIDLFEFSEYYERYKDEILFVVVFCSNRQEFKKRVIDKFIKYKVKCFNLYYEFYKVRKTYTKLNSVFYDTYTNEYVDYNELLRRISWLGNNKQALLKSVLKEHLELDLKCDKTYQDIECLGYIGYTQSYKTWDNIKDLVEWSGKRVADLGCLNCYFSFKVAQMGAKATGFTNNVDEYNTSMCINDIEGYPIEVELWDSDDPIPGEFDIILCLNALHWFHNIPLTLKSIKAETVIFETNLELIPFIEQYFTIVKTVESHRRNTVGDDRQRIILLCERKPEVVVEKRNITVLTVVGIRPDFIRMSKIFEKFDSYFNHIMVHTGQHYDNLLSDIFFDKLQIRKPNYNLEIGGSGKEHFHQTAELSVKLIELLRNENIKPDVICFLGDSNSVMVSAILKKEGYKIAHIEAGMRSHDKRMLEEINRIVCDHCSDHLFVYHDNYKNNAILEGISQNNVYVVGNTIVEPVIDFAKQLCLREKKLTHIVLDIHRPENFKYKERLLNIILFAKYYSELFHIPIKMLGFNRTIETLFMFNIDTTGIDIVPLMSYYEYLRSAYDSLFVISDSGTAQEELSFLKTKVIVPRDYTERPESMQNNCSVMVDVNSLHNKSWEDAYEYIKSEWRGNTEWLGNGKTSDYIVEIITNLYLSHE